MTLYTFDFQEEHTSVLLKFYACVKLHIKCEIGPQILTNSQ